MACVWRAEWSRARIDPGVFERPESSLVQDKGGEDGEK